MIDRRPALIARCAGPADVISCVNFARNKDLVLAVRGGGHSFPGHSMCDGGLVIDLSHMKSIRVDPVARTARAESGATWLDFDRETQAFGLATTGGTVSGTGIAGLTLGGGMGWLGRKYGLTSDNLLSADIVTADGRLLTSSDTENEDLFWAIQGRGWEFWRRNLLRIPCASGWPHGVGRLCNASPMAKAKEVLKFYDEFSGSAPDELMTFAGLLHSPNGDPVVGIGGCYNGPLDIGEQVIRPLKEYGPPVADMMGPMPYTAVQTMIDQTAPPGWRYYDKAAFLNKLSDDAIDVLVDRYAIVPSPNSVILLFQLGGATSRLPQNHTAYFHRDAVYHWEVIPIWQDAADDEKNIRLGPGALGCVRALYVQGRLRQHHGR